MKTGRRVWWGTAALMLAVVGCGSSGTGGAAGKGGNAGGASGNGGTGGAAGAGGASAGGGSGGASGAGGVGASGGGGASPTGGAGGASGSGGSVGSAGNGGAGGIATGGTAGGSAAATLLVDNDASDNNDPTKTSPIPSASDALFTSLLAVEHIGYDSVVVPSDGTASLPSASKIMGYSTVIWYTGNSSYAPPTISTSQETTLENWLDLGHKTLMIFSEDLMVDLGPEWTTVHGNPFLADYLGLKGGFANVPEVTLGNLADVNYTVTGSSAIPAFANLTFKIDADVPLSGSTADAVNPSSGTDVLLTTPADPQQTGTDSSTAVATGFTKGTSRIIYVGIPLEDLHGAPTNTNGQLFHACLKYAGLVAN